MNLVQEIEDYCSFNEQEKEDKELMLLFLRRHNNCFTRKNKFGHFTASVWAVNKERTKVLMIYHKIYNSWSWIGGHADGQENLKEVALKELGEETGIRNLSLISDKIFSIEILTVDGHEKKGEYVPGHLHFNITYLVECDEREELVKNEEETEGVRWCNMKELPALVSESWMLERIYQKLMVKEKMTRK